MHLAMQCKSGSGCVPVSSVLEMRSYAALCRSRPMSRQHILAVKPGQTSQLQAHSLSHRASFEVGQADWQPAAPHILTPAASSLWGSLYRKLSKVWSPQKKPETIVDRQVTLQVRHVDRTGSHKHGKHSTAGSHSIWVSGL